MIGQGAMVPAAGRRGPRRSAGPAITVGRTATALRRGREPIPVRPQIINPGVASPRFVVCEHGAAGRHRGPDSGAAMAQRFPLCTALEFVLTPVQPCRMRAVHAPVTGGTRSIPKGTGRADNGRVGPWSAPAEGSGLIRNPTELPAPLDLDQPGPLYVAGPGLLSTDEISPFRDLEE